MVSSVSQVNRLMATLYEVAMKVLQLIADDVQMHPKAAE